MVGRLPATSMLETFLDVGDRFLCKPHILSLTSVTNIDIGARDYDGNKLSESEMLEYGGSY